MSDQRHGSEGSLITYRSQASSEGSDQGQVSPRNSESRDESPKAEEERQGVQQTPASSPEFSPSSPIRSPRSQRVRFKSNAGFDYDESRSESTEEKRTEGEKSKRREVPHRPSTPFEHGSTDIADVPTSERTTEAEEPPEKQESIGKKAEHEAEAVTEEVEETTRDRFRAGVKNFKEKTSKFLVKLGRDEHGGDPLHPAVYHEDWGGGGQAPLSDVTDNKHKTEEEKRRHHATSSSEAGRLVRELNQDQSAHRRKSRGKPYPHEGTDVQDGEGTGLDSGLRYRSGGGGVLSQLMKLNNPQQQQEEGGGRSSSDTSTPETPGTTTPSGAATPRDYGNTQSS